MLKIASADSWLCATCTVSVPGRVIVCMKNRAAIYVVIPTCRAFSTMFRLLHLREYSCCARFKLQISHSTLLQAESSATR